MCLIRALGDLNIELDDEDPFELTYSLYLYNEGTTEPAIFAGKDLFTRWANVVQDETVQVFPKKGPARINAELRLPNGYNLKVGRFPSFENFRV